MINDHSYGIVPFKKIEGEWHVFLVQHSKALYWGFPKGHPEKEESPKEAASRELTEETNLRVVHFVSDAPLEEHYKFKIHGKLINKTVWYFVAIVDGDVQIQQAEISSGQWVSLNSLSQTLTYETDRAIARQAVAVIQGA